MTKIHSYEQDQKIRKIRGNTYGDFKHILSNFLIFNWLWVEELVLTLAEEQMCAK